MRTLCTRALALCVSAGLCLGALAGCSAGETSSKAQTVEAEVTYSLPDGPEEAEIYVEPVEGISDDFIRGMDASAVLAEENSGVVYYNYEGEVQDVFQTLAQSGVNYIRLRVWNDPYDANGNGYGGGNCDVASAVELGKRATQYGMKVLIDFHYSDFWADPKRQHAPKAWENMTAEEKSTALYDFTKESLATLLDAGVDVGMVQVGNEINNGMAGETDIDVVMNLLASGSKAVRETAESYGRDIQVALHYTNIIDPDGIDEIGQILQDHGVDYDIFGLSYYPYWGGTMENMQNVVKNFKEKYGKQVMIAETAYCYTEEDGDGSSNSYSGGGEEDIGYAATVQSQATMVRDIFAAANEAGAMGVFYWEGTWIPVGSPSIDNSAIWEKYGSGWASSYSAEYDPDDAGLYYGGCSWDNQAMFDFTGHPLASLNVFKYLKYGATAPLAVDFIPDISVTLNVGAAVELPETVQVVYNDRSANKAEPVTWDADQLAAVDTSADGTYTVTGALADGSTVNCTVEVLNINYVPNPSFEDDDRSMWQVTDASGATDYQKKADDAHSGDYSFHFWAGSGDTDFTLSQTITGLEPGTYVLTAYAQGGDVNDSATMELFAETGGTELTASFMVDGYANWQDPTIHGIEVGADGTVTIGVRVHANDKSWGTFDDFTLNRVTG